MDVKGCLKIISTLGCIAGFAILSGSTFNDYMAGSTTVVKSTESLGIEEQTEVAPVVLICSKSPFKDPLRKMDTVQSYINNTIDVNQTLLQKKCVFDFKNSSVSSLIICVVYRRLTSVRQG